MKISEVMEELLGYNHTYKDILTPKKYIYGQVQSAHCWFKKNIKTMNLMAGLNECNTSTFILYITNEPMNEN